MAELDVHDKRLHDLAAADAAVDRTVLAEQFQGKRLNSPNDIVVKSDGAIYFTNPSYGVQPSRPGTARPEGRWKQPIPGKEQSVHGVYRILPDGRLDLVVDDFALPNGLAFSPDESALYIDDSAHKHIRVFAVRPDGDADRQSRPARHGVERSRRARRLEGRRAGQRLLHGPGWSVGVPSRRRISRAPRVARVAGESWGAEDGSVLHVTARTSVYRLQTRTWGTLLG